MAGVRMVLPILQRASTPWAIAADGTRSRQIITEVKEKKSMTLTSPPTTAAPARRTRAAAASPAPPDRAPGATRSVSFRATYQQLAAVTQWRAQFAGLDHGAALRALIDIALAAPVPDAVVDPIIAAAARHARVGQSAKSS